LEETYNLKGLTPMSRRHPQQRSWKRPII